MLDVGAIVPGPGQQYCTAWQLGAQCLIMTVSLDSCHMVLTGEFGLVEPFTCSQAANQVGNVVHDIRQ